MQRVPECPKGVGARYFPRSSSRMFRWRPSVYRRSILRASSPALAASRRVRSMASASGYIRAVTLRS